MAFEASTESRQYNGFAMRNHHSSTSFDNLFANLTNFILFSFLFKPFGHIYYFIVDGNICHT